MKTKEEIEILRADALAGDAGAQNDLGCAFSSGDGVVKNLKEAFFSPYSAVLHPTLLRAKSILLRASRCQARANRNYFSAKKVGKDVAYLKKSL